MPRSSWHGSEQRQPWPRGIAACAFSLSCEPRRPGASASPSVGPPRRARKCENEKQKVHFTGRVPFVQHLQPFFFIILFFFSFIFFFILFPVRLGLPLLPGAAALHLQLRQAGLRRRRAAGTSNPSFFTASKGLRERHTTGEMHFPLLAFTLSCSPRRPYARARARAG